MPVDIFPFVKAQNHLMNFGIISKVCKAVPVAGALPYFCRKSGAKGQNGIPDFNDQSSVFKRLSMKRNFMGIFKKQGVRFILLAFCWASVSTVQAAQSNDEFIRGQAEAYNVPAQEHLPVFLPEKPLFQPLLADPRWPHFSASYQRYLDNDQLKNVVATSFGESFGIYRFGGPWNSTMEFGVQAGVFSIFDLDSQSFDLINADYLVGFPIALKKGNFTNMFRIFHQSSHLGDEYLLRGEADKRINLSYESVDNLFSYYLPAGFRIYAGGGYLFRKDPSDLDPWSTQAGLEFRSPKTWLGGALRPVAGVDVQNRQETDWDTDVSARTGVQFENPDFLSRKLLLLLEYYSGKSPNGQFYENSIEFIGIGVHLFF